MTLQSMEFVLIENFDGMMIMLLIEWRNLFFLYYIISCKELDV